MENEATVMINQISNWTPELIVSLVKELAWPIVVLILGFRFRASLSQAISNFFKKNQVSELTASTGGVTAKFREAQQNAEIKDKSASKSTELPEGADYQALIEKHKTSATLLSDQLYEAVQHHLKALNISDEEKIVLLSKEAAILQAAIRFIAVSKVLFRSQFDLFNYRMSDGAIISQEDVRDYFEKLVNSLPEGYEGWDVYKYMAYPVDSGLVQVVDGGYELTILGKSLVQFMRKNPSAIDELAKL